MTGVSLAHIGGVPLEETLALYGPMLVLSAGAVTTTLRARLRLLRASPAREQKRTVSDSRRSS